MNLLKNYIYNLISIITGILFPFFTFPYISRVLGPDYFGKISFTQSFVSYFTLLSVFGATGYALKELSKVKDEPEKFSYIFTEIMFISFISGVLAFFLGLLLMSKNSKLLLEKKIFIIFLFPTLFSFMNLDYIFIIFENHKRRTIRMILLKMISIILILYLIKNKEDYILYSLILVIPEILARIIDFLSIRKKIAFKFSFSRIKKHIKTMIFIFGFLLSSTVYINIDATMIGYMSTDFNVGLYSTSNKLVKIIVPIICCLGTIIYPKIVQAIKNKKEEEIFNYIRLFFKFTFFLSIPAIFLLIHNSKEIIVLISGEQYKEAYKIMNILTPTLLLSPIAIFMGAQILNPNDKEKTVLKVSLVAVAINIILNYILIPKYIGIGAAIATLMTEFVVCVYRSFEVKRIYPNLKIIEKTFFYYIFSGIVSFILMLKIEDILALQKDFFKLLLSFVSFAIVYIFILFICKDEFICKGIDLLKINLKLKKIEI